VKRNDEVTGLLDDPDAVAATGWSSVRVLRSLLCSADADLRRQAARALGHLAAVTAAGDPEKVRDLLRRLFWSLNDESGNSGLGVPEAIAEIIARRPDLWAGYVGPLLGRLDEPGLREALMAAVTRLAGDPALVRAAAPALAHLAHDPEADVRAAAREAAKRMGLDTRASGAMPE